MKRTWLVATITLFGIGVIVGCSAIQLNQKPATISANTELEKKSFTEEYLIFKKQEEGRTTQLEF